MNNDNKFNYTYAAPTEQERSEVESIRRQYAPVDEKESSLERLRKLDVAVKRAPLIVAIVLGIAGVLLFGLGMTMVLEWNLIVWGIAVAAVGIFPVAIAHPVRQALVKRNKQKYGDEILRLSDEILNNKSE